MKKILALATLAILIFSIYFFSTVIPKVNKDENLVSKPPDQSSKNNSPAITEKNKTEDEKSPVSKPENLYLKIGDTGDKVKELQSKLNKFKYNLVEDGEFGSSTDFALRNFQSKVKLRTDGVAGPETIKFLNSTPAQDPYIYKPIEKSEAVQASTSHNSYEKFINSQNCVSATDYYIYTNLSKHIVCIFVGSNGNWKLLKSFSCSVGAPSSPTITGHFTVGSRGTYFVTDNGLICKYYTQISGNYLFHSILYDKKDNVVDSRLGVSISHGCIRLSLDNAKYIYENIPSSTPIWIQ